ncbi:hypothetical protein WL88_25905 [Burkholderia diffusa]|uniref:LysR family transcriptional regulator n=1 Tax=Burkholderia diffusa TaxID=488732 RepID=A0AAW3PAW3_9BURK|nr:hypothetical protein WL86_29950 [Burkholderia diffusa]KWF38703.1 hypothetical protein WL85_11090 [Burkholderia diffusa]KWF46748.1 hypothetical protein WL88_25905 [Burkholderia diffusa]KWF50681.1 hypothetical protein WL87_16015 [Burkholderia diffusa]
MLVSPCFEELDDLIVGPVSEAILPVSTQVFGEISVDNTACQIPAVDIGQDFFLKAEASRRMACTAMTEAFDQIAPTRDS